MKIRCSALPLLRRFSCLWCRTGVFGAASSILSSAPASTSAGSSALDVLPYHPSRSELLEMAERNDIVRGICGRTERTGIFLARVPADIPNIIEQVNELLEVAKSLRVLAAASSVTAREALLKAIDLGFRITATRIYDHIWKSGFEDVLSVSEHYAAFRFAPFLGCDRFTVRKILEPMSAKNASRAWERCRSHGMQMSLDDHQYRVYVLSYGKDVIGTQTAVTDMKNDGWAPNLETYRLLARALAMSIDPMQTLDVLQNIRDACLVPDQSIYREIIRMHCALGDSEGAKRLLASMLSTNRVIKLMKSGKIRTEPDELILLERYLPPDTDVAPQYRQPFKWDAELASAVGKYSPVKHACLPPAEAVTFTPILSWVFSDVSNISSGSRLSLVKDIHAQIHDADMRLDFRTYTGLIKAYLGIGDADTAIGLWEDFRAEFGRCAVLPYHLYTTATQLMFRRKAVAGLELAEALIRMREQDCGLSPFRSEVCQLEAFHGGEPVAPAEVTSLGYDPSAVANSNDDVVGTDFGDAQDWRVYDESSECVRDANISIPLNCP